MQILALMLVLASAFNSRAIGQLVDHAEHEKDSLGKFVVKLVARRLRASHRHHAELQSTLLGKAGGHVLIPPCSIPPCDGNPVVHMSTVLPARQVQKATVHSSALHIFPASLFPIASPSYDASIISPGPVTLDCQPGVPGGCADYQASLARRTNEPLPFDYERPKCWGASYPQCVGTQQSPIRIGAGLVADADVGFDSFTIEHGADTNGGKAANEISRLTVKNNGHTLQVTFPKDVDGISQGGKLSFAGDEYRMLQYHLHFPAEHAIGGDARTAGELHLVHQKLGSTGLDDLLVIGILIDRGEESDLLSAMGLTTENSASKQFPDEMPMVFNLDDHLRTKGIRGAYYTYDGSLTTPPCSESVRWVVMEKRLTASPEQIKRFKAVWGENSRPLQEINGRKVQENIAAARIPAPVLGNGHPTV
eukprot:gnl/TRDRNA2_/TRDRNA2_168181_c1_seq1.p1 gnl/TRDRNA2_/TRDRNA2_168181_c1~~gnl/TRDRNA2_/TRDRNA2_168181_c1_seq1.p1  ORF type:complete len:421 (+),score=40.73 gnl/TRDRNA2_/TRDRNA2_168181_c1_seq1:47-1309(+)